MGSNVTSGPCTVSPVLPIKTPAPPACPQCSVRGVCWLFRHGWSFQSQWEDLYLLASMSLLISLPGALGMMAQSSRDKTALFRIQTLSSPSWVTSGKSLKLSVSCL